MSKKRLTKKEREALGPQLSDMPQELPSYWRDAALDMLLFLAEKRIVTAYLASSWHQVPATIRGKWMVRWGVEGPVGTLRQWTYKYITEKAVREVMGWQ